jgi:hypothetical protein
MITKVKDNWYTLKFNNDDGDFACFGCSEEAVRGKFATWYRQVYMSNKIIRRPINLHSGY